MVLRFFIFGVVLFAAIIAREIILLGFFSVVISVLLSFPIRLFNKVFPRAISVTLTLLLMAGLLATLILFASPTISKQVDQLKEEVPKAAKKLQEWAIGAEKTAKIFPYSEKPDQEEKSSEKKSSNDEPNIQQEVMSSATQITSKAVLVVIQVLEAISTLIFVVVLAIFFSAEPEGYRKGVRLLIPTSEEKHFDELWHRITVALKHWVGGVFIDMTVMGTLAGIGLWIVGIDDALALGILTFFATFVPYLGAILSSIPGLSMGLAKSPSHMLYAAIVYLFVHILEGYIVGPLVMKQAVQLKPALLLFGQVMMGILFGIVGVIVATPFLVCLQTFVIYTYIECKLGKEVK